MTHRYMPRFSIKTLLIVIAVAAIWLSTLAGYPAGRDVQSCIMLFITLAAAFAAAYNRGRTRAFWLGFAAIMLVSGLSRGIRQYFLYLPLFDWIYQIAPASTWQANAVVYTVREAISLSLAVLFGRIAVRIYDHSHKSADR